MGAYYYASGQKVELEDDDEHVAIDQKAAREAGLDEQVKAATAELKAAGGVVVAERAALDQDMIASLEKAGALHSVYKRDRAVVVALPECRIEVDNAKQHKAVLAALADKGAPPHTIVEKTEHQIIVRPRSGNGDDALKLANYIYEHAKPAAASVRFVQVVPKPTPTR